MSKKWFIIEGNIGTGKSTLIKLLNEKLDSEIIYEPLDEWLNTKDNENKNILDHFYNDTNRWAFTFQVNALITRALSLNKPQEKSVRFVERSIHTDKNVFAKNSFENKQINSIEYQLYDKYYKWISDEFNVVPNGYIYLRADPNISFDRINKRARSEEDIIPFEYIEQIHKKHDDWLLNNKNILVINVNGDFEKDTDLLDKILNNIKIYINNK